VPATCARKGKHLIGALYLIFPRLMQRAVDLTNGLFAEPIWGVGSFTRLG